MSNTPSHVLTFHRGGGWAIVLGVFLGGMGGLVLVAIWNTFVFPPQLLAILMLAPFGLILVAWGVQIAFLTHEVVVDADARHVVSTWSCIVPLRTCRYGFDEVQRVGFQRLSGPKFHRYWMIEIVGPEGEIFVDPGDRDMKELAREIAKMIGVQTPGDAA